MLGGVHLREQRHGELVLAHCGPDARVVAQPPEVLEAALWVREVGQWEQLVEGVLGAACGDCADGLRRARRGSCGLDGVVSAGGLAGGGDGVV